MKHQKRKTTRRWHVLALCLCVAFSSAAAFISSAEEAAVTGGICAHHTEHTPECGYAADISGSSCSFTCPVCSVQDGAQKDDVTENKAPQKRSSARTVPEEITENGLFLPRPLNILIIPSGRSSSARPWNTSMKAHFPDVILKKSPYTVHPKR